MNVLNDFDIITLTVPVPEHHLRSGDVGTVLEIVRDPRLAYEVEFAGPDGVTKALVTLLPRQVRKRDQKR